MTLGLHYRLIRPVVPAVAIAPLLMGMAPINGFTMTSLIWISIFVFGVLGLAWILAVTIHRDPRERGRYRRDSADNAMFPYADGDDDD